MEHPIKMDDLGVPPFKETPTSINPTQVLSYDVIWVELDPRWIAGGKGKIPPETALSLPRWEEKNAYLPPKKGTQNLDKGEWNPRLGYQKSSGVFEGECIIFWCFEGRLGLCFFFLRWGLLEALWISLIFLWSCLFVLWSTSQVRHASSLEFKCCRNLSLWCDFMSVLYTVFSGP